MFNLWGLMPWQYEKIQKEYFKSKENKMSKELTTLEKLHWLVDRAKATTGNEEIIDVFNSWGKDIETALKRLEEIDKCLYLNNKKIKALEIIKEKKMFWSIEWQPFAEENDYRAWDNELYQSIKLTKEEYDLLKEVLL